MTFIIFNGFSSVLNRIEYRILYKLFKNLRLSDFLNGVIPHVMKADFFTEGAKVSLNRKFLYESSTSIQRTSMIGQ